MCEGAECQAMIKDTASYCLVREDGHATNAR